MAANPDAKFEVDTEMRVQSLLALGRPKPAKRAPPRPATKAKPAGTPARARARAP